MPYFKATFTGLAAVVVCFGVLPLFVFLMWALALSHGGIGIGIDFHWKWGSPRLTILQLAVFAIAFIWQLRRSKLASRKSSAQ